MTADTDFESLTRQAWEAWSRQWQGPSGAAAAAARSPAPGIAQGLESLKGYLDWMQRTAMGTAAAPVVPPMPDPFGSASPWMQAGPPGGFAGMPWGQGGLPPGWDELRQWLQVPAVGYGREQQARRQALMLAALDCQQANARYGELLARAQADGAQRLQAKLADPETRVETLKGLYGLWVDAFEDAYQAVALSDEFRGVYGDLVNAQMRLRRLRQQEAEQWCRELGLPTRAEVETLARRLQELRRELRGMSPASAGARGPDIAAASPAAAGGPKRATGKAAVKKAAAKKPAAGGAVAKKPAAKQAAPSRSTPRAARTTATRPSKR